MLGAPSLWAETAEVGGWQPLGARDLGLLSLCLLVAQALGSVGPAAVSMAREGPVLWGMAMGLKRGRSGLCACGSVGGATAGHSVTRWEDGSWRCPGMSRTFWGFSMLPHLVCRAALSRQRWGQGWASPHWELQVDCYVWNSSDWKRRVLSTVPAAWWLKLGFGLLQAVPVPWEGGGVAWAAVPRRGSPWDCLGGGALASPIPGSTCCPACCVWPAFMR